MLRIHAVAGVFLFKHWKRHHSQRISQHFWEPLVHVIHIYQESSHPDCVSNSINRSLFQTSSFVKHESDQIPSILQIDLFSKGFFLLYFSPAWWHKPHNNLLQEFTSGPVVIPRQRPRYRDVSYTVFLRENSLAPYLNWVKGPITSVTIAEEQRAPQKQVGEQRKEWWDGNGSRPWF